MHIERISLSEWADILPENGVEVFHWSDVLTVLDEHATGELRLFCGFKGSEPVGLLPVFVREAPVGTAVLSPPPGFSVPRLGPVVMSKSPKRRKREAVNQSFTRNVLEAIGADDTLTLFWAICSVEYTDPRPYTWYGFDVEPRFTYRLDLTNRDGEDVLSRFTRDLRTEVRKLDETPLRVTVEGPEAAERVYDDYRERFAEQGANFPTPRAYTRDLVTALDDHARVYVAETPDGEFFGGITVLYSNDTAYFWQGGMRANYEGLSVNSLLHWRIIEDVLADEALDTVDCYDLGRAVDERLARYKSKFGSDLVPYYEIRSGPLVSLAKRAYKLITY